MHRQTVRHVCNEFVLLPLMHVSFSFFIFIFFFPVQSKLTLSELLTKAVPHKVSIAASKDVWFAVTSRFPVLADHVVREQSISGTKRLYELYEKAVKKSTLRVLGDHGMEN
jgi:hypothetical protein